MNVFRTDDIVIIAVIVMLTSLLFYKYWRNTPTRIDTNKNLEIDKLIEQVKQDLENLDDRRRQQNKEALFTVESFDLEINFVVRESQSGEAGLKYEVVTVGGKSEVNTEKVQKITLRMKAAKDSGPGEIQGETELVPVLKGKHKQ